MSDKNKIAALADIATELLVNELARRAQAQSMSVDQLVSEASKNWDKAEKDVEDLANLGHDAPE